MSVIIVFADLRGFVSHPVAHQVSWVLFPPWGFVVAHRNGYGIVLTVTIVGVPAAFRRWRHGSALSPTALRIVRSFPLRNLFVCHVLRDVGGEGADAE